MRNARGAFRKTTTEEEEFALMSNLPYDIAFYILTPIVGFVIGAIFYWVFRKVRARLQSRRGPPWYQTFADVTKLLSKESITPEIADKAIFYLAPLLAFAGYVVALLQLPFGNIYPPLSGDLIVVLIFLTVPGFAIVLGGLSSGSPYGAIGSSREITLLVAGEVPFVISALVTGIQANSMNIFDIVAAQSQFGPMAFHYPFATISFLMGMLLKLGRKPFDIPDAEVEIVAGPYTEYSGSLLGLFEISNALRWFVIPAFAANLFFAGGLGNPVVFFIICLVLVILISFIDAINTRYRIDQAFKFVLIWATLLAIIDLVRATTGWALW
jgi:NADH-quinone oxidoreductase subunit H